MYNAVSLFSGAGGLDLGFDRAGFHIRMAVEINPHAVHSFVTNFNHTHERIPVYTGDIRALDFRSFRGASIDVVFGGAPCQDFTITRAYQRGGTDTERGKLYLEFVRALHQIQPRAFVFENVQGLKTYAKGDGLKLIINSLQDAGYALLFSDVIKADNVGVPQRRKRLFILGIRKDLASAVTDRVEITDRLLAADSVFAAYPLTTLEVFEGKPLDKLQDVYERIWSDYHDLAASFKSERASYWRSKVYSRLTFDIVEDYHILNNIKTRDSALFEKAMHEHGRMLEYLGYTKPVRDAALNNDHPYAGEAVCARVQHIPPGECAKFVAGTEFGCKHGQLGRFYRRSNPLTPASTILSNTSLSGQIMHYDYSRAYLSSRERARLQTFPDNFRFAGRQHGAQIGNAVPPLLAEHVAKIVYDILDR